MSGAIAAVFILVVVLFFSQLLSALPEPVLAAVVLVAVASLSLVLLIRRASLPPDALLGRIPGTCRFSDRERHPENETCSSCARPRACLIST